MGARDRPLYLRVYRSLRAQMENGDVKVGDFLPPEPELQPIALITNYLLPDLVPGIEKKILKMKSLYSFLEEEYAINIEAAPDYITAKAASPSEAEKLYVPEGAPLLVVRRITQSDGRPIEVAILLIIANKFEYSVYTKERPPRSRFA
jgi:GntR family transcriptional regulator